MKDWYTKTYKALMKKKKKTHKNGKIFCSQGLEELILLKCTHYPKKSADSVQSLTLFQWYLLQK